MSHHFLAISVELSNVEATFLLKSLGRHPVHIYTHTYEGIIFNKLDKTVLPEYHEIWHLYLRGRHIFFENFRLIPPRKLYIKVEEYISILLELFLMK